MAKLLIYRKRPIIESGAAAREAEDDRHDMRTACYATTRRLPKEYQSQEIELMELELPSLAAAEAASTMIASYFRHTYQECITNNWTVKCLEAK